MAAVTIYQPVSAELPIGGGRAALPAAFWWRGQRYDVAGYGRNWRSEESGEPWQCHLAQTNRGDTVELRRHEHTGEWQLARAWWRETAV